MSAVFTAVALIAFIIFSHTSYALEETDVSAQPALDVPFGEIVTDEGEGSEPAPPAGPGELPPDSGESTSPAGDSSFDAEENEESGSPSEDGEIDETSSGGDSSGENRPDEDKYKPDFLDSGYVDGETPALPTPEQNIYAIRRYMEFALFGLIPIALAVAVIACFCVWFYKTFIPRF